ncbi:hypothetical protein T4E_6924 [Trichinella pseudospiralis]|uniref:Uncharacterized protein n=1 Tax=Trichinella pseudospiralis TaxID=6337 RepID=A0A0V0XG17_TRIPS|nr:hypothetical protein T4E_6924 [Trichinella pseudospiralis]
MLFLQKWTKSVLIDTEEGHLFQIYWIVSGEYSSENFENFKKRLFLQKWTKWMLVDSEQSFKSNEGIPNLPG